ncbi:TetR family transcriptional regulator C-terminal domain-containing protein [Christiangramia sp. SM2212]|uniref:TetR family transcriptional regulator C-terminal domain-containing protein n=1 Tax=Christiangramia sediminicola TaxID=3073267 RepID=A0ABU1ES89_9FLAO|nr:TetR family transcriptional regulator C-terminal domain-containing protein [Christiangramia sp. SM2212]MDR5590882.1 TetR family transcriptional regulator C-terminal domain-containing protein [Christiangramia sp. SM2212]
MAKTTGNSKVKKKPNADKIIAIYMDYVLENEKTPKSVYKFAKDNEMTEQDFYQYFGSFDGLRKTIWDKFFENSLQVMQKSKEYAGFSNREKLLTFFYTFFEVLTANRSYVLYTLKEHEMPIKNLEQLKTLRKRMKNYAKDLIQEGNKDKNLKLFKQNEMVFSEGVWVQFLFLLKFWMDDNSAAFESTDVAIEKSVNTVFDLFDNTPLERVVDFGKFLWKERMA